MYLAFSELPRGKYHKGIGAIKNGKFYSQRKRRTARLHKEGDRQRAFTA